jgi:hypothetical protein
MMLTKRRRIESYMRDFGPEEFFARAKVLYSGEDTERVLIGHCHHPKENGPPYPNGFELDLKKFYAKRVAKCTRFERDEVIRRVRETTEGGGEDRENSSKGAGIVIGGERYEPVSLGELGIDPDQGGAVQKTVRKLDETGLEVVSKRLGTDSDAATVRACVEIAKQVLTEN